MTVLDHLLRSLALCADHNGNDVVAPRAILWPETVAALRPMYLLRAFGGTMYLVGAVLMVANVWLTIAGRQRQEAPLHDARYDEQADRPLVATPAE